MAGVERARGAGSGAVRGCENRAIEQKLSHPLFARIYERVAAAGERRGAADHRRRLLAGLDGRVIEVGAGSGANFAHYPSTVQAVTAVEPDAYLRERAKRAGDRAATQITVRAGSAHELPCEEGAFDAGIASLVLCTVPDQQLALAELFRVIRPGGELRFYEHVVAEGRLQSSLQHFADAMLWPRVAGGCHLARDTGAAISRAGFQIEACERFDFSPARFLPSDPHLLGVARRP